MPGLTALGDEYLDEPGEHFVMEKTAYLLRDTISCFTFPDQKVAKIIGNLAINPSGRDHGLEHVQNNTSISCQCIRRSLTHRCPAAMRVKKTKEAARAREKQKTVAAQAIDPTDPEYAPPSDEENITPMEKKPIEMKQPVQVDSSGEVEVSIISQHNTQPHVLGLSSSSKLQAAERAPVDSDSDIKMISAPDPTPLDLPESLLSVPPIDDTPGPFESPLTSESSTTTSAPAPASDPESDNGYLTGDSDNDKKIHELSLTAIEATFKRFEVKIQKYCKAHLSARALMAMTPEKGAQHMVSKGGCVI
ncbi:hypothetical protein DFH07DRAFT_782228 [Mycena maculata]|uniref:Uncharacterized protein n=1 Tax=Mycena maculata TaxID=230809 RepID=A0AAD7MR98_9AGAR|nr:hypothetical protein DFH07DRAFT_782228 [Mycena maculata]